MAAPGAQQRLAYIDWLRGLACLLMFQTHCYDSWLGGTARAGSFMSWSQLGGTLPAPFFLFLAGVSFALVTGKMRRKGASANQIAITTIRRGAEIFGLGLLFRVQEFILGQPWAPWTDLFRVDILNTIGASMMLMGVACRLTRTRAASTIVAAVVAIGIGLATPPLYTTWRPHRLPWYLESYINGVHTYPAPQPPALFRFFRGRRLHLPGWQRDSCYSASGLPNISPRQPRCSAWRAWPCSGFHRGSTRGLCSSLPCTTTGTPARISSSRAWGFS